MPKNSWVVERGGENYYVLFEPNRLSGGSYSINGFTVPLERRSLASLAGVDIPLKLGDSEAHLVVHGQRAFLAVDGVYVDSGRPYVQNAKLPWFCYVFCGLCLLIPLLTFGGLVPILLGFFGVFGCVTLAANPQRSAGIKALLCFGVALLCWAVLLAIGALLQ